MVVMSKSCSDIPANTRFCGGVTKAAATSLAIFEEWVLDRGLVVGTDNELAEELARFERERRRVGCRGAEAGLGLWLSLGLWL